MFSVSRIIIVLAILAALGVFVYFLIYSRHINEKIARGEVKGKRMIDIPGVIRIAVLIVLILYAVLTTVSLNNIKNREVVENRNDFAVIDLSDYTYRAYGGMYNDTDASFARSYSKEENPGYLRAESTDGDYTFTVFTRIGEHDAFHPDYLCFVDHTGKSTENISQYEYYEYVDSLTMESLGGIGSGGGYITDGFLVVGNLNDTDSFRITLSTLDSDGEEEYRMAEEKAYEEDKGEFPAVEDYAESAGSVVITVK